MEFALIDALSPYSVTVFKITSDRPDETDDHELREPQLDPIAVRHEVRGNA